MIEQIKSAFLAGVFISIGATAYLSLGGVIGAIAFSIGLLGVVHFSYKLYTGFVGFCKWNDYNLPIIIFFNVLGCLFFAFLIKLSSPNLIEGANDIFLKRISLNWYQVIIKAFGCGILMTTAVKFARENKYLPLLFCVPVFILCGFLHSIADAFYYFLCDFSLIKNNIFQILKIWFFTIIGNYLGCRLHLIINK